jgi:hypothetical protein
MKNDHLGYLIAGLSLAVACGGDPNAPANGSGSTSATGGSTSQGGSGGGVPEGGECAAFYPDDLAGYYAAPEGSAAGDGSEANPWDLQTALSAALAPGDTLWLRGGVYGGSFESSLTGESGAAITVRSYPGEWAVIDGGPSEEVTLSIKGAFAFYRDFEITNTKTERYGNRAAGMNVTGKNLQLVNLMIHDTGNNGFWESALDLELYGCLIYENGYDDSDRAHGHGVYTQNSAGRKHIVDNAIFNGYSFGIHAYTEGGHIENYDIVGNIWFGSGIAAAGVDTRKDNCLVGGLQPAAGILLQDNIGWAQGPTARSVRLGYSDPANVDATLTGNFLVGATTFATPWQSITMTGNTFFGPPTGVTVDDYPDNEYLTDPPAEPTVIVRPNQYEPGRAHVAVFNWHEADTVSVDLGDLMPIGMSYEIRNIQDYFGDAVVAGIYDGKPISLPMDLEPVQPVGVPDAIADSEKTGKRFNAFVVLPQRCLPGQ